MHAGQAGCHDASQVSPARKQETIPLPGPPSRDVPYSDDATEEDLGKLIRYAVGIIRAEAGHQRNDPNVPIRITVTLRG